MLMIISNSRETDADAKTSKKHLKTERNAAMEALEKMELS